VLRLGQPATPRLPSRQDLRDWVQRAVDVLLPNSAPAFAPSDFHARRSGAVMQTPLVRRAPAVLPVRRHADEARAANAGASLQARSRQVLQSSRAPAQLSLFLRPSAIDVK
jgi:hypothetical protein